MDINEYFGGWIRVIDRNELFKVTNVINNIYKVKSCEPSYSNIFKAFNITPYNELKIISLAQDPYPQKGVSTGICFANNKDAVELSPSLQVLKESIIDFGIPHYCVNFDPSLEEISRQGVLLLNSALTVETNKIGSHTDIWRPFISNLLKNLSIWNPGLIYILWGNVAKTFKHFIGKNNIVYTMPHPAYYARTGTSIPPEFFKEINNIVHYNFGKKIEWFKEEKFKDDEEICNYKDW